MNDANMTPGSAMTEPIIEKPLDTANFEVKQSIKVKIGLAFAVAAAAMILVAGAGFYLSSETGRAMDNMGRNATSLKKEGEVSALQESARADVLDLIGIATGEGDKVEKLSRIATVKKKLDKDTEELLKNLDENSKLGQYDDKIAGFSADMKPDFMKLTATGNKITEMSKAYIDGTAESSEFERKAKIKAIQDEYTNNYMKTFKVLVAKNDKTTADFEQKNKDIRELAVTLKDKSFEVQGIALALALVIVALMVGVLFSSLNKKIAELLSMIDKIKNNDLDVSYHVSGEDEMKLIGHSLKTMATNIKHLQANNATILERAEHENLELNESIVELLQTVFAMTQKDLTVKAEVKENVVGTIADSINMVIQSTNVAMVNASQIAEMVQGASVESQDKSNEIFDLSRRSKEVVDTVIRNVEKSLTEIQTISRVAQESKLAADKATESTSQALAIVKETVSSMGSIRETISTTETKIKKLAERSQEIGFIVQLIGDISERTHVLALNATIQAAVAGDAGRGFAAIAEEIQKLAENTKEATNKIARLVENIQVETSDTIQMVNQTIDKVVSGVKLAESSGQQMTETQGKTVELALAVKRISEAIAEHETLTGAMKVGAESLGGTQDEFSTAAQDQLMRARSLLSFSHKLQETVNEFKTS